ncbi:hypothetical protein [Pseudodesulfovibrio sediminis]|uniref:Uncharacterized protein n=1 Tax=Pseudodesulfovibrio sediminis TaxID=2810563 RepID=A0ABN6EQV1_9BACT|nr:hypothetical protein [Pseudodesulfovibrio sediminis]BCS87590.1 hypothetical protein PSDVSF_08320 [Pseudodesulfovibrio sediminis]
MALIFGSPKKQADKDDIRNDQRLNLAKDMYMAGKMKIMTTETVPGREIQSAFGLIVCRSYVFDNAFYGLMAQAVDVNADAIIGYRETVAFHPEGDKYYSCYGTAVRMKKVK